MVESVALFDFEVLGSDGVVRCRVCGAQYPTVRHTSNCPHRDEDPRLAWTPLSFSFTLPTKKPPAYVKLTAFDGTTVLVDPFNVAVACWHYPEQGEIDRTQHTRVYFKVPANLYVSLAGSVEDLEATLRDALEGR